MSGALEVFWQDMVYAARGLRKSPVFALASISVLALGIAGSTAMFTVIRSVLLKPLQYEEPERLVQISGGATIARFEELKSGARSFSGIGAYSGLESLTLSGGGEPEVVGGARVSANFLSVLRVRPMLGRGFALADNAPGATPTVIISAELWRRRFGADAAIMGKSAAFSAAEYTIVGVLPPGFEFPFAGVNAWMTKPEEWPMMTAKSRLLSPFLSLFGRLKPDVSMARANAEMVVAHRQYAAAHPAMLDAKMKSAEEISPMKEQMVAGVRAMLWMLFGAVSFVLLIACANVASLLLARASSRSREFAVRAALGAGRGRLVRQLLAESVLLSSAGGLLGVALAAWSLRAMTAMTAFQLPRAEEVHADGAVLGFAAALSIGTGLLFGLAPSLSASRPDLMSVLRGTGAAEAGRSSFAGMSGRGLLVAGQIALSVILLIGGALLMQSIMQLRRVDMGFRPANILTARVSLPAARYDTDRKKALFFQDLVRRVREQPGVRSATAAMFLPLTGFVGSPVQDAAQAKLRLNERPIATALMVLPEYFRTLNIAMRRGRDFSERDIDGAPRVTIIDEALARRFWPGYPAGRDPIGQHLLIGGIEPRAAEIVGVVADVHQNLENTAWPETVYVPFAQSPQSFAMVAARTEGNPLSFTSVVREQVRRLDGNQAIAKVETMDELVDEELGQRNLILKLLGVFAAVALLLALIGVYGVISYSVAQRVHELGIRWALGAGQGDIVRLVMGQGLRLTLAGIVMGIAGALALTRVMKSLLFQVSTTDPAIFAAIPVLLILVALAAAYVPARRATRVDPMTALRV